MSILNTLFLQVIEPMASPEFFGIEIFNDDFYKLITLFGINLFVTLVIGRLIYYPFNGKKKEFLFAYIFIASVVFFLCFALKAFKFNTGVAIGLFALLGIIRFRTDPIPIKDMSYLFIFIGLSMINAFSKKMSIYEIAFINLLLMSMATFAEIFLYKRPVVKKTASMELVYGNLLNLKPENRELLISDISTKTGMQVENIKVGKVNLKTQEVEIKVTYLK
ncbi:DUF4956 domain-containing protein [Flavobacteriales bacterium]|jgi:hypothetical protein|nr:DUF4956 domain-containing protein [Flavobacteriales bacterium]MDB9701932.1 DUF4956 domain-containing protein [Flavobacteriales bacterium]MDC1370638.1 DUF4956 domain-containing protein [Flavobacteriales bacterium]MDG1175759.1 DUF4956 domain-containing protein [Flavobacteriales bacterium]